MLKVTTERYEDGHTRCPECESDNIEVSECKSLGEVEVRCNDCDHVLFYHCKADERD